ncbi:vignain-like [Lolium perenne]|uniref:vignain-like n=1 Tax=Lolium perenne TaxID=4522 RepID=UPI0021F56CD5|nr:ervatamin-B-like [Lolium perenne]
MVAALAAMALAASTSATDRIYVSSENVASEEGMRGLYERWYTLYRHDSDPIDKEKRFAIFKAEARAVYELNEGGTRVKHHLNWFADMTQDEFSESFANCAPLKIRPHREIKLNLHQPSQNYPDKLPLMVDWRTVDGVLTSVKLQGECGSCWAMAAAGAMESIHFLKNNKRTNLSVQELVDCSPPKEHCKGGRADMAFQYVIDKHGIHSSEQYPYNMLMDAVAHAPVVIRFRGSNTTEFKRYSGGIFRGLCDIDTKQRHEALLVGYGTTPSDDANDPGVNYWLVKNSWGESWGERGYMRLQRGHLAHGGLCGILRRPVYPAHPK